MKLQAHPAGLAIIEPQRCVQVWTMEQLREAGFVPVAELEQLRQQRLKDLSSLQSTRRELEEKTRTLDIASANYKAAQKRNREYERELEEANAKVRVLMAPHKSYDAMTQWYEITFEDGKTTFAGKKCRILVVDGRVAGQVAYPAVDLFGRRWASVTLPEGWAARPLGEDEE